MNFPKLAGGYSSEVKDSTVYKSLEARCLNDSSAAVRYFCHINFISG